MRKVKSGATIDERIEYYSGPRTACGCRLWTGSLSEAGYAVLWWEGRLQRVSRLLLERKMGSIPDGILACHSCDTPDCVEESHIFAGSHQDNVDDCIAKGRNNRGERHGNAKLTEADVIAIRSAVGSHSEVAAQFGVVQSAIYKIRTRRLWGHVA